MNIALYLLHNDSPLHFPASGGRGCGAALASEAGGLGLPGVSCCRAECRKTECGSERLGSQSATSRQPRYSRSPATAPRPRVREVRRPGR